MTGSGYPIACTRCHLLKIFSSSFFCPIAGALIFNHSLDVLWAVNFQAVSISVNCLYLIESFIFLIRFYLLGQWYIYIFLLLIIVKYVVWVLFRPFSVCIHRTLALLFRTLAISFSYSCIFNILYSFIKCIRYFCLCKANKLPLEFFSLCSSFS